MTREPGLASWLQLALTPGLGPVSIRELLSRFGLPEQVLAAPRAELRTRLGASVLEALEGPRVRDAVAAALEWAERPGHAIVTFSDAHYPKPLLEIPDPPPLLFAHGRLELLARPALAVVGSRNATAQGLRDAERFAVAFGAAGLSIVSGLALGIDAAAHGGALATPGSTIAVLGTGIDVPYPARNAALFERIAHEGLLLSEFGLGAAPAAGNFPRRNRLISGLSRGCLVVEAALASGSLITARAALEQGREVFAVPGSIHSPLSKGCHALIKSGAKLVESADDVLSELGLPQPASPGASRTPQAALHADLLEQMGFDPFDVDSLCRRTRQPVAALRAALMELEIAGQIATLPGGRFQRLA